jgi:hypothetical protein
MPLRYMPRPHLHSWVCLSSFPSTQPPCLYRPSVEALCPSLCANHCLGLSVSLLSASGSQSTWPPGLGQAGSQSARAVASVAGSCSPHLPTFSSAWSGFQDLIRERLARSLSLYFPDLRPLHVPPSSQHFSWAGIGGRGDQVRRLGLRPGPHYNLPCYFVQIIFSRLGFLICKIKGVDY